MITFVDARLTELPYSIRSANAVDSIVSYDTVGAPLEEPVSDFFHLLLYADKNKESSDINNVDTQDFFVGNLFITNSLKSFYEQHCPTPETAICFKDAYKACIAEGRSGLGLLFACLIKIKLSPLFEQETVQQYLNEIYDEVTTNKAQTLLTTNVNILYEHFIVRANQRFLFANAKISAKYFIYLTQIFEIITRDFKRTPEYRNYLIDILAGKKIIDFEYLKHMKAVIK